MDLICEERASDSPYVERVWRAERSEQTAPFISMAAIHSGIVLTRYRGRTVVTVRGPETRPTPAKFPAGAEFFGILFRAGAFLPKLPPGRVIDRRDVNLPGASGRTFWLDGDSWQFPDYENADTFVDRLVRAGALVFDPIVGDVLSGRPAHASPRTVQRRFAQATGLTQSAVDQIARARRATALLKAGASISDAVFEAGYFDHPHLTRSLKRFIGLTPTQITDPDRSERLSLLYKTDPTG